jgi:tyrosinase
MRQKLDLETRGRSMAATRTFLDIPPSENGMLEDVIKLGYVGVDNIAIEDAISTMGGSFCYVYA